MSNPQFRGEVPAIAAAIAQTRKREYLYGQYVQASLRHYRAVSDDELTAAYKAEQEAWDAYRDECFDLGQCQHGGCYTPVDNTTFCPQHDENPPDYGD